MLKEADSNAMPTKYAQNKRHGMYEGTLSMMNFLSARCSAPKTAKGTAKHKLLKATILSRPPARAISVFAAHSETRKSRTPALHIEAAVREISKNVARMVVCMWMPGVSSRALSRRESPFWVQKRSEVYTHANGTLLELRCGHAPPPCRRAFPCSRRWTYRGWPRRRLHSPRAERMKVKPPSPPSAQSVQTKKKPPVDLAISP